MKALLIFVTTYLIISLPDFFGFSFAVQWVPGVSDLYKAWTYFSMGLSEKAFLKLIVSAASSVFFAVILKRRSCLSK
ncbi:hypothetical protein [Brevibacillus borstelensis]|uniref:Uncharacterized protein n=1 Tax=Brevibacillus borstelensis AK1 TaxID=1300222 RepID=M8DFH8_9BACL|nr:hypothetical protein [Brevibacillus borstelensis]EMT52182.1 hypothetical protein I532_11034 [Brevibacillus borstelensis AK1]KKX54634.1 hypothetical protein X546_12490 [Brevibacillus borstelensis cifa_chp40]MCM3625014.1 hypothetical protein [Brevibacillus borstelensis]MED1746779.1 hypothetical protein [Brevibacillus borstelensis]MED1873748.1 hypothetical protein [Brevibacillus borstelensis]